MLFNIKRKTTYENRYSKNMGRLKSKVVRIKLYLLNVIPIKKLHEYRETYYGKVKDIKDCKLDK